MIGNQQKRPLRIGLVDILDAENVHQIVSGKVYPQRPDVTLAECPKRLPGTEIHTMRKPKSCPFYRIEHGQFFSRRRFGPG
jgi:hypothetical protein